MARSRSRSQSPDRPSRRHHHHHRSRSRSPHRASHSHHHHRHHKRKRSPSPAPAEVTLPPRPLILPFKSTPLSKHDLRKYRPMLASYLDIQKQIDVDELTDSEVKGRWKAFVANRARNRGELAEGWYDPQTLAKAIESAEQEPTPTLKPQRSSRRSPDYASSATQPRPARDYNTGSDNSDDQDSAQDEDWGPVPPPLSASPHFQPRHGPAIPNTSDLALRDDLLQDDAAAEHKATQLARKAERTLQRERLDELAPRAEPGTRERQLEKKREAAAANRTFAEARGGGDATAEVGESELMGAADGGVEEVKRMKANMERKKNERELRREEVLRARAAEREERIAGLREREDKTMSMLKAIAKERFG